MPSVTVHTQPITTAAEEQQQNSPLPPLLRTPHGLAIVEIQGSLNIPDEASVSSSGAPQQQSALPIGRLHFPDANADLEKSKKVYFYVGKTQRLVGEVKPLAKPLAVIRRRNYSEEGHGDANVNGNGNEDGMAVTVTPNEEELEIVDVVRYKLFFGGRPEFV